MSFKAGDTVECSYPPHNHTQRCIFAKALYKITGSNCSSASWVVEWNGQRLVFNDSYMKKAQP